MNSDNSNTNQPICAASASSIDKPSAVGQRFIDYWDNVVRQWINLPMGKGHNASANNKYKDSNLVVSIENEQLPFFTDKILKDKLCPAHLPEPYWGDPDNCSIVIINYNPGGGTDMSPHTYKFTNGNPYFLPFPPNTMIEYVHCHSYSCMAKDFPIWRKNLPADRKWLESYGGRDWWVQKKGWVKDLVDASCNKDTVNIEWCPPFAIELCGWHSRKWPSNWELDPNSTLLRNSIHNHFADPLLYSIEKSSADFAVCIGAQFSPAMMMTLFSGFRDITTNVNCEYCKIYGNTAIACPACASKQFTAPYIQVTRQNQSNKKIVNRYYRIYDINNVSGHHIIINTYAPGGNHHPAGHFYDFEKKLIRTLKRMKLIQPK